ncbi:hypothetical protein HHX47_DHR6000087 [Lentinula edodes]|nr:hypothetical protein HHX47_DHR6000087 [Lentinula edodes]
MAWSQNQIRITTGGSDTTTLPALYSATLQLARSGLVILRGLGMDSDTVKWPISEETKIMVEHAIALREWLAKYMDVADPIAAVKSLAFQNNTGISAPVPPKPVYQPGFPQPDIIASAGSQGATLRIFDYKTSAQCELTRAIARDARKNMEAYPGTIEAGPEVAMAIFKNHVGARKCVTHSETNWRGKSVSARFGHLECGCPNILALVELFVKKIVAQDPGYIAEAKELGRQMRTVHSEYKDNLSFTLGNLLSIQHSLQLVSGLSVEKLLQPKINRLLDTSEWAVDELISLVQPEHRELLGKVLVDLRNVAGNYRVAGIQ